MNKFGKQKLNKRKSFAAASQSINTKNIVVTPTKWQMNSSCIWVDLLPASSDQLSLVQFRCCEHAFTYWIVVDRRNRLDRYAR